MFFAGYPGGQHEALLQFLGQSAEWRQHMMDGQALLLNQPDAKPGFEKIGRASCRERVYVLV